MPVPISISELSTTPGSNSPVGADAPSVLDDHIRALGAFIRQLSDAQVALTGDQTIAGVKTFSSTPVVPSDSFTFAKLQNIATARILGRSTSGSGDIEELTSAQATALLAAASTTAPGIAELATDAETQTGTDPARVVTPAGFAASSFGYSQTPAVVTRTSGVTYTNTTGKPITLIFYGSGGGAAGSINVAINGGSAITIAQVTTATFYHVSFPISVGATYIVNEVNIATRTTVQVG